MAGQITSHSSHYSLNREQKLWLTSFGVFTVYSWIIMCAQPRDWRWQFGCGVVHGILALMAMNSFANLVRGNRDDAASNQRDGHWRWLFAGLMVCSLLSGGLLGVWVGQLGIPLGWNGWQVYMANMWCHGLFVVSLYVAVLNLRGRSCLRRALRQLRDEDFEAVVRTASIGLLYDLGQPLSREFTARLRFLRGKLLIKKNSYVAAEDFRRLAREGVAPETSATLMRTACEQFAAQIDEVQANGPTADSSPASPDDIEQWFRHKSTAEDQFEAAARKMVDSDTWLLVLLVVCLVCLFFMA